MKYFTEKNLKSLAGPLALVAILGSFAFTMASIDALNLQTEALQMAQVRNATEYLKAESSRKSVYLQEDALKIKESIQLNTMLKKAPLGNLLLPPNPPAGTPPVIGSFLVNGSTTPAAVDYEDIFTATWSVSNASYCEGRGYHIPRQNGGDWMDGSQYPATGSFTDLIAKEGAQNGYSPSLPLTLYCVSSTGDSSYQTIHLPVNEPEDEVYLIAGSEEVPGSSDIGHRDVWKTNDMNTWNQIVSDNTSSLPWSGGSGWTTIFHDDYIWQVTPYHVSKSTDGINWTTTNANPPYSSYPGIRLGYSVDSWNGYLWITGGRANNTSLNDVWKSVDGVTWVQVTTSAAWGERKDHESFVFNNKLWIMGGQDMSLSWPYYVNDIWSSLDGVNWTNEGLTPWYNKVDGATVVHEGAIYTAGGGYGGVDTNDVWKSIDGANWTQINTAASWSARVLHDLVSYDGKLWVVGGRDVPTSYLDPVVPTNGQVWSSIDGINWSINTNTPWNNRSRHKVIVNEVQDIVAY